MMNSATVNMRFPLSLNQKLVLVLILGVGLVAGFTAVFKTAILAYIKPIPEMEIQVQIPSQSDWVDYGTIFEQGEVGEWDYQLWGGFAGTAVKRNGTYYLYYQGASGYQLVPDETVTWRAIGVATSTDGVNFTKYSENPVLTWFPTQDGEEGAASGGATLDQNGNILIYYGANTSVAPTLVNADGRLASSTDGFHFNDLGVVLDHADSNVWANGDELFPVIAFQDSGQWFVYYIPNVPVYGRKLGVAWGNGRDNLTNSDGVSSGGLVSAWGMGGSAKVGPGVYALFINDVTVPKTEVRTVSLNSPEAASAPIETYQFDGVTQATVLLDEETNTWFMYYRAVEEYGLKLAPAGAPDTTPPTAPTNVEAVPLNDRQVALSWDPATDSETGIVLYNIFRDGIQVATVKGWEYMDTGLVEQTDYSYQVSAVNYHGVEGPKSPATVATTPVDITPPQVVSVNAGANQNQVTVVFNEPVEQPTIGNVAQYFSINDLTINSASLAGDQRTLTLMTSAQVNDNYLLTVIGLHDRAQTPNPVVQSIHKTYTFEGIAGLAGAWGFNQSDCATSLFRPVLLGVDTSNYNNNALMLPGQTGPVLAQGKIGNAFDFDGVNDHLTISGSFSLENVTDTSHTFAAWVYPDSVPPAQTDNDASYTILARDYTGLYYDADRKFRAKIKLEDGTDITVSSAAFNPGVWHHVAMTVDDVQKELHLFVDGQEVAGSPVSYSGSLVDHEVDPYFVGTSEPLTNRYENRFNGRLDEVRLYNRALTPGQINSLFTATLAIPVTYAYCTYFPAVNHNS